MSRIIWAPRMVRLITFNFARAITLYPFILLRHQHDKENRFLINHERIHIKQQLELLILPFYICYLLEYAAGRMRGKTHTQAYMSISFEKEAFENERNLNYLSERPHFAFIKYRKRVIS